MESFEKEKIFEREKLKEREVFFNSVKDSLLNNFPFESDEKIVEEQFNSLEERIEELNNEELVIELKKIINSLDNSHTAIKEKETGPKFVAQQEIRYIEGSYWIQDNDSWVRIKAVDDQSIDELIENATQDIPGGTQEWKRTTALELLRSTREPTTRKLKVFIDKDQEEELSLNYEPLEKPSIEKFINSKTIGDIGYLQINAWPKEIEVESKLVPFVDLIDKELEKISNSKAIIIDVRENGGGNSKVADQLAGRFMDESKEYSKTKMLSKETGELEDSEIMVIEPREPRLEQDLVILTGPKCLSSNEMFIMSLADTGRAKTVGETTGGGSGNPEIVDLRFGDKDYILSVSTWKQYRNNGQLIERQGIEPDIEVHQTIEDLKKSKDSVLEKAINYLS